MWKRIGAFLCSINIHCDHDTMKPRKSFPGRLCVEPHKKYREMCCCRCKATVWKRLHEPTIDWR